MFSNKAPNESYFIAEVGQNHQGDVNLAREYIKLFADAGADAIKFQTRNNKFLFNDEAYNKIYNSENAFAWIDESRIQWLTDRYSEPEISYFDSPVAVNNDSNKIYIK